MFRVIVSTFQCLKSIMYVEGWFRTCAFSGCERASRWSVRGVKEVNPFVPFRVRERNAVNVNVKLKPQSSRPLAEEPTTTYPTHSRLYCPRSKTESYTEPQLSTINTIPKEGIRIRKQKCSITSRFRKNSIQTSKKGLFRKSLAARSLE